MAEIQLIQTDKFGTLRVVQSFNEDTRVMHLLENGAYVWDTGLPPQSDKDLKRAIPVGFLQDALDWWNNRHKALENPPKKILVMGNNHLVFEDGSPVENIQDVVDFFEPGPFREAALIAFATKLSQDKAKKPGPVDLKPKPPKRVHKKAPLPRGRVHVKADAPSPSIATEDQPPAG